MVKVSVILPVFNVENYLRDCLNSIVNQTLTDLEIICINDGSTDNSPEILKEYGMKDKRIIILNQTNKGHAVATNKGIELAKGECLFCMDADDFLETTALETSYNKIKEKDPDFVMFKVINYDENNNTYYESEKYSMNKIYDKVGDNVFNYHDLNELMFETCVAPWNKLYKREFITENNIHFPEGLIFEDNVFYYNAMLSAKKICFIDEFLTYRRWYPTSSTTNGDLRFISSLEVTNLMIKLFKDKNEYENYKKILLNNKIEINFMRYNKIKKKYKEAYFTAMKEDFLKIIENKELYEDFTEVLRYRNKRIFEHIILSENSVELDLLRKVYDTQMKSYKLFDANKLFNNYIKSIVDKYLLLNDNEKNLLFNSMKDNFIEIISNDGLYEELMKHTSYTYQKFFEQILISENSLEFEKIRRAYDVQMKSYKLINKNLFNDIISLLDKRIQFADKNNRREIFDNSKNFLIEIVNNTGLYERVFSEINYSNKKRFNQMLISENNMEYLLLRKVYDTKMNMNKKVKLEDKLKLDYEDIEKFNNEIINSNSWKLTSIFRKLDNI